MENTWELRILVTDLQVIDNSIVEWYYSCDFEPVTTLGKIA